ncbi:hypothetical protein [Pseudomonas aeruginosa]|uniref:hypothetical protein n=1 Tax=Pseudomonas aeruginosa TaxID=287 RepID=UPI00053CF060|nr:hypothetical protein [Pseudomonas aeruginosa]KRU59984.1 hypothetical protein AN449_25215 [Pseudomonas aeruginosa]VEE80747.1 Uncharacterised protein [Pseudomonas aeruginosa]HBP1341620.1 hypothetical protein [Pseudomonas aeruginosa]
MKCKTLLIACLFGLGSAQALAVSKLPPQIPVHAGSGRVTLDLRPLLAETNDVEITRVSVCRRVGSHCQEALWRIELPPGWRAGEIEVFGDYPGSSVLLRRPERLQPDGSYNAFIHFNERSRRHRQTVSSIAVEFCLAGEPGNWMLLDEATCLARRNAEERQGEKP